MAQKEQFYKTPVDRTPYGACATIGVIGIFLFVAGSVVILRASSWIQKKISSTSISLPTIEGSNPFSGAEEQLQNLQQTAQDAAKDTAKQQEENLKQEAANAARIEIQNQVDSLKDRIP